MSLLEIKNLKKSFNDEVKQMVFNSFTYTKPTSTH